MAESMEVSVNASQSTPALTFRTRSKIPKFIFLRLTLFGRSLLLLTLELLANAACWVVCGILFGRNKNRRSILSLALLAWTIGLRHALDADHISAIDNATRGLINLGQLPVTCGLFFSLGHSTIVIVVNVAIAISTDIYDKIGGVGTVGAIVGGAVSASFLFIVGLANSVILWKLLRKRRQRNRHRQASNPNPEDQQHVDSEEEPEHGHSLMMKILGPITTFVDRPWKMYPVGVLFGFGFDTASSIALLAISALAKQDSNGRGIPQADIIILPLLFTAGMTIIDSVDSILMLYSYAGLPERSLAIFEKNLSRDGGTPPKEDVSTDESQMNLRSSTEQAETTPQQGDEELPKSIIQKVDSKQVTQGIDEELPNSSIQKVDSKQVIQGIDSEQGQIVIVDAETKRKRRVKMNTMSGLSILLTLISILVAFSISLIEIMGLIGSNCRSCELAANAPDGGGLTGSWWRGWAEANNQLGLIGAAIVGSFVLVVLGWHVSRWALRRMF